MVSFLARALTLFFKCLGTLPLWTIELDHGKGHWATVSLKGTSSCVRIFQVQAIQEGTGVSFLMASFTICGHSERDKTKTARWPNSRRGWRTVNGGAYIQGGRKRDVCDM